MTHDDERDLIDEDLSGRPWSRATALVRAAAVLAWCDQHSIEVGSIVMPAHLAAAMDQLSIDTPADYLDGMRALRAFLAARD